MINTDYTIQHLIESMITFPSIISYLVGILVSLIVYKFAFLGKKTWFGNDCSVWTLTICIVTAIVLLILKLFWLLPCILLMPVFVVGGRYFWLGHRKKQVLKNKGLLDYDKKRYEYFIWLSHRELFRWEVKKFLFPAMNILFEIGAIKRLDDELESLSDYKDWYKWKRLKSYVHWNRHEFQQVINLMAPYVNDGTLSGKELARVTINIYGSYRNLEDKEGIDVYVKKLENILFLLGKQTSLSEIIRTVKSSTTRWINEKTGSPFHHFAWQDGYGAFSVSNSHVDAVAAYIKGQEEHHKKVSFQDEFRKICELYNAGLDERYAWD